MVQCNVNIKFCLSWLKSQHTHVRIYTVFQLLPFFSFGSVSLRHIYTNKMCATVKVNANKAGKRL